MPHNIQWSVSEEGDDCFKVEADSRHIFELQGLLFVADQHESRWRIETVPQHGENVYM